MSEVSGWEHIEDDDGFDNVHGSRDGEHLGDIIATVHDERCLPLILAAPDLLEVAKTMRDYVADRLVEARAAGGKSLIDMIEDDLARLVAAIAKAEGPSS